MPWDAFRYVSQHHGTFEPKIGQSSWCVKAIEEVREETAKSYIPNLDPKLAGWLFMANFIILVNAFIWWDNYERQGAVWCDICECALMKISVILWSIITKSFIYPSYKASISLGDGCADG